MLAPQVQTMSSPGTPSSPSTNHISDYYYFVVAVAVVAILLLASNMLIVGCCSRFSLLQSLKRFLRSRGLLSNPGDNISRLIPPTKYRNPATGTTADASECSVCLTPFVDGEEVRQLPECKHSFHVSCIDMWLYSHSNCPNCRARVVPKGLRCPRAAPEAVDGDRRGLMEAGGMTGSVVIVPML